MNKNSAKKPPKKSRENVGNRDLRHGWIKTRIKEIGKTQIEVSKALKMAAPRLNERIQGKTDFEAKEIPALARELNMPVNVVFARITGVSSEIMTEETTLLEIRGEVKAGQWARTVEWRPEVWEYIMVTKDAEYSAVYGLRVTGDDMEEFYPPNRSTVLYVPYAEYKKKVGTGDHVIVLRADGAGQYELTVKAVNVESGRVFLEPHSQNPSYKSFELIKTDGAAEYYGTPDLKIIGVVLKAVIDHTPPKAAENRQILPSSL